MDLLIEQRGASRILTLNRPQAANALTSSLAAELLAAIEAAGADTATRTLIVIGAGGRAFCAGADLKERRDLSADDKWAHTSALRRVNHAVMRSPKVVIAAIDGWCLGGGFELALYCDLRLATGSARFGFPEMTLGSYPGAGGAVILPRIIGRAAAKQLMFTARQLDAAQAQALGLLERITSRERLLDDALALAEEVHACSPLGVAAVKPVLTFGPDLPFDEADELDRAQRRPLEGTEDYAEGIRAHFEKRKPVFRGR
ncbi:MAG TPA: enoyl-CoA hydratase-related protein [Burkholderiaceae bacterium]|nr:enoyl-CoA hydratase-related protein [Burkholderiaceae bacterium]